MVIADSAAWIDWLRNPGSEVGEVVESLLATNQVVLVGIVLGEVLQGARTDFEFDALLDRLDELEYLHTDKRAYTDAALTVLRLRKQGKQLPLSDAIIAEVAKQHGLPIYSRDRHFERVPGLHLYSPEVQEGPRD